MTSQTRRYVIGGLRWLSALSALLAVVLLFRVPLARDLLPGLDRGLAEVGVDSALGLGPAPGFNLQARSEPAGAQLWIDGEFKGKLPFVGNVICRSGQRVELEARLDGHDTWRRVMECREGGQLDVTAKLVRSP